MDNGQPVTGAEDKAKPPGGPPDGQAERQAGQAERDTQDKQAKQHEKDEKDKGISPPAVLARFPKLIWLRREEDRWPDDWPMVKPKHLTEYRQLADDLTIWREQLEPRFLRLDHRARKLQNQFWRQNVLLIAGGLVATSLGAIQAALGGGIAGLAVAQAVLTGVLAGLTVLIRSRRAQQGYLTARLKAERIKSEFFLFLGQAGDYAVDDPGTRRHKLNQQVDDIEAAEGVT